jgi:hypothetical protein
MSALQIFFHVFETILAVCCHVASQTQVIGGMEDELSRCGKGQGSPVSKVDAKRFPDSPGLMGNKGAFVRAH